MQVTTDNGASWPVIVLVLIVGGCILTFGAIAAFSGRFDLHVGASPEQIAQAETIKAISVKATQQALEQIVIQNEQENRERELDLAAKQRSRDSWESVFFPVRTLVLISLGSLITVAVLALCISFGSYAYLRVRSDYARANIKPVEIKAIGFGLLIVGSSSGPMLVDALTGSRALLSKPEEVNMVRASAMIRLAELKQSNQVDIIQPDMPAFVSSEGQ